MSLILVFKQLLTKSTRNRNSWPSSQRKEENNGSLTFRTQNLRNVSQFQADYKEGTMKLIHPDNLQIRPREIAKELGPNRKILDYNYLSQKEQTKVKVKEFRDRHLDPKQYSSKQPHLIFETKFLKQRIKD